MLKKRLFLTLLSTFLIVIISIGISFAWYTNKKVDDFESPDVTGYSTAAYYAGGDGSAEKPFLIKNSRHLYNFAWLQYLGTYNKIENGSVKQYYFEVIDDIDCEGLVLPPIGTTDNPFLGNFNGGNYTIENVTFSNNYNDLKKKPASINSTTKFTGCEIIGFFGVVGKYGDYLNVNISSQVNSVYDFTIDGVKINNACTNTLAGLIAGFVNGNMSNVGVHYGKINLQAATSKISSFKNISSYTLIGDYDEDLVSWEDKPTSSNGGNEQDFGDTINFKLMHQRMSLIGANAWVTPTVTIDNPNDNNANILESVLTNRSYMPLVVENDITESYYSSKTSEDTLDSNIGYFVGSGAYLEKAPISTMVKDQFVTRDEIGKATDVRVFSLSKNNGVQTHTEVTDTMDSSIKQKLVSYLNDDYLYGIRFTAQISHNQPVTITNAIVDNTSIPSINVPNSSIWFKPLVSGTAKVVSYPAGCTRSLSLYEITRNDNNSFGTAILQEELYMNGNEWNQTFYYFEIQVEAGHEYAIGSANGSDTAHFVYMDIGQNAGDGAPSVKPEIKDFAIEGIDFVYLNHSNNTFSSTSDDYSNVFFQISGTTTSIIDLFFRRNNDDDDNYAGSEGIVLFLPKNSLGEEWTTTSSGKTDGDLSLDWSYAGTKGLSGTSTKYPDETACEVLSGNKVSGGLANTNTGVNTKRTITYYYRRKKDDGSYESVLITKGTVTNGYAITQPDFEITGYEVVKWYTDEALTQEYDFSKAVTENIVLYASVTETETFTVSFMDGENELQTLIVNSGSYASPAIPRKEGSVFSHWIDASGNTVDLTTTTISADTVLTAVWLDAYDIKFAYNVGGDDVIIDTVEVEQGSKVTKPDDPTLDGYNFAGWYTTKDYTTEFSFDTAPSADTTIYAKFVAIQYYDVVFGYMDGETLTTIMQAKVEEKTLVEQPEDPTRVGYVFGGWYSDSTCTTEFDFSSEITADTTIYAKWQESLVVTFEYEDETTIDSVSVLSGNTITATSIVPSKDGYRFDGNWYVKASDGTISGTAFDFADPIEANTILVPGWIKTYEVTIVYGNGTNNSTEVVDVDTVYEQPAEPTREGYNFNGWYSDSLCTVIYDFSTPITTDTTIYAGWVEKEKYTVSFDTTGGTAIEDQLITEDSTASKPEDPTREGYYFGGWYSDSECTLEYSFSTPITTNTTIYAKWIEIYTITFDVNGGEGTIELVETDANGNIILPTTEPTREGYVFMGWYTGTDISTSDQVNAETQFNGDTTIYAGWKIAGKVSVTFDANGGTHTAAETIVLVDEGSTVSVIDSPTHEGNVTFSHWSLTQGGEVYDFDTAVSVDITLYAVWTYKATVTFNAGEGTPSSESMTVNSSTGMLDELPTATLDGYSLVKWVDADGNEITITTKFDADTTVYAEWQEKTGLNVTLQLNGGTINDSSENIVVITNANGTLNINDYIPTPPSGKIFAGWYNVNDNTLITSSYVFTEKTGLIIKAEYKTLVTYNVYSHENGPYSTDASNIEFTYNGYDGEVLTLEKLKELIEAATGKKVVAFYRYGNSVSETSLTLNTAYVAPLWVDYE